MLSPWPRPHYRPHGGEPILFYAVFGSIDKQAPLDAQTCRSQGVARGLQVSHYTAEKHAQVFADLRSGYLWESLVRTRPALAGSIAAARECIILNGAPADSTTLNYLRDAVGLLTHFLDHGGVGIFDPQMFYWWSPEQWKERIFRPAAPVPTHHVQILKSDDPSGDGTWLHTRGLRKFGRPDLSMHKVSPSQEAAVIDMFNRFIEHQAFGAIIPEGQAIRMETLPAGLTCRHRGHLDDPEFNNVHVEIMRR